MKIKNMLAWLSLLALSTTAIASSITVDKIYAPDGLTIYSGKSVLSYPTDKRNEAVQTAGNAVTVENKTFNQSSNVYKQARGIYDFAISGGATSQNISLGMNLPINAVIQSAVIDVITNFSGVNSPTVGISSKTGADILGDTAVASLTAGIYQGKPAGATRFKLTAATNVYVNIKTGALNAGKMAVFIDYLISE